MVACTVLLAYDVSSWRLRGVRDTGLLADVIGTNSTAALAFGDAQDARETPGAVSVNPHIVSAATLLRHGMPFAVYQRNSRTPPSMALSTDTEAEPGSTVEMAEGIERIPRARLKHGRYSKEAIAERVQARALARELCALIRALGWST